MEGAGERLVVVRGLQDSGLAITLINNAVQKKRHNCGGKGPKSPTRSVRSNVETNTEQIYRDSAVQIDVGRGVGLDGYYVTPTIRAECPQRSPAISRMFHSTDAFVGSLRKYPISSNLEKSQSAEIVQRILTYAQGRNFGKKSKSKSMRSLLRRCSTHRHVCRRNKRCGGVTDANGWWGDRSEPLEGNVENGQEDLDLRYNYLSATMSRPGIEVRYLTDMKRALCDKIKDMCENTTVCPRMQTRFSEHKKRCNRGLASGFKRDMEVQASRATEPKEEMPKQTPSFNLQSKISKACFCHSPRQCVCETKAERIESQKLIEDELVKMYPELANILQSPLEVKKDLPTLIEDEVSGWVDNILPFYNINFLNESEKLQLKDNLVRALHDIEKTDPTEATNRIKNCLHSLPALRDYEHRDTLIKELSDNLVKKLRFVVDQNKVQNNVDKLVDKILAKSNISDKNKDMIKKAVVHKLKPVLMNKTLPEKDLENFLTDEILDVVQKLPIDIKDMDDEFRRRITVLQEQKEATAKKIKEKEDAVLDWVKSLPELSDIPLVERKKLITPLIDSLAKEDKPEKMKVLIKDWLNDVVNKGDRRLSSKSLNKLSKKLLGKLVPSEADKVSQDSSDSIEETEEKYAMDTVMSWFQQIPEIPFKSTPENMKAVESLANKLKDIQRHADPDDVQVESRKEVSNWLKDMLKKNNISLHPSKVDNLVNKLVNDLQENEPKRLKLRRRKKKLNKDILHWFDELPYVDKKKAEEYKKHVVKLAKNLGDIDSTKYDEKTMKQKVTEEVNSMLNDLSDKTGLEIYEKDKQHLINMLFNQIAPTPKGRKKWHKTKTLRKGIQDAVSSVLDKYPPTLLDKENVITGISNLLHKNFKSEKKDPKKTRAQIVKYLAKNTKLPSNDINNIANNIMHNMKTVSKAGLQRARSALSPKSAGKKSIADSASEHEYPKSDSMSEEVGDDGIEEYDEELSDGSAGTPFEQRGRTSFVTSTPKRKKASIDSTVSQQGQLHAEDEDEKVTHQEKIKNVLNEWLKELNIDENLKRNIIDDLTEDIIDRHRYLKLSNTKTSSNIELEHLKFQIFKRLNKVISDTDLSKYMTRIKHLKTNLDTLKPSADSNFETLESLSYKIELKGIISKSVPASANDDSFEALKNNLADAFVSLHYSSGDEEATNKYKKIIYEEINRYCYDYLKRYPASSLDPKKLNRDLYSVLIKVPAPERELLEPTHNISKIQKEIRNWLIEITTDKSSLKTESARNSILLLATNLYSIQERHKSEPSLNVGEEMLKTILDWLEHFPITSGHKVDIKNGAKVLFTNITSPKDRETTKQAQEYVIFSPHKTKQDDSIKISVTTQNAPLTSTDLSRTENGTKFASYVPPPSTLSAEDRAHLDMIRARSPIYARRDTQIHLHKDAWNDPQPMHISTQTDVAVNSINDKQRRDSAVPQTVHTTASENTNFNVDVSPHVIVKEYLWKSNDSRQGSTIYSPRNPTININTPPVQPIGTGAPINMVTHTQYPQAPPNTPIQTQENVLSQTTNVSTTNHSAQQQDQSNHYNISKRTQTFNPECSRRERPVVIHENISQTHIERPDQRGYFINTPNYEDFNGNERPLISGYLTPREQALQLERTLKIGEKYVKEHVRGYTEPYFEEQENSRRFNKRQDRYDARYIGQRCCRCGGRVITKCRSPRVNCYRHGDEHKMCSKCFGRFCPHPSSLYFNNDF